METVLAPSTEPGPPRQRTTTDGRPSPEEPTLTENERTRHDRTPLVAPLAVAGVGILLTVVLALGGHVAPGNALPVAVVGAAVGVLVAVATTYLLHRARRSPSEGERSTTLAESRRDLVAWVSDDLRTPLARLQATAEALEDGAIHQPAEVAAAVATMHEDMEHVRGLLTDLRELSHPDAVAATAVPALARIAAAGRADAAPTPTPRDLVGSACTFDVAFRSGPGALGVRDVGPGPPR
ncbi:histidine kinase dimerization/phospho-acceptor domain-containing protein [Iamia majanohamensis]|uniref:histidine kinase n=1 Tax=Iamia majanohamensis TaxID=467976 RepID=A0AAF0BUL7_9ACTN|nr:histidine kinase dimerization/phospho-acceptor domain-containing protein [Iamia majanohamensis]WCO66218.1 histidine kinase dimerization/phospho-acceptor domain-containing protein [Iamia majanohamensis]